MPNKKNWCKSGRICTKFKITLKRQKILKTNRIKKLRREKSMKMLEKREYPPRILLRRHSRTTKTQLTDCPRITSKANLARLSRPHSNKTILAPFSLRVNQLKTNNILRRIRRACLNLTQRAKLRMQWTITWHRCKRITTGEKLVAKTTWMTSQSFTKK